MYQLYRKSPLGFGLAWIGIYCVLQSIGNVISDKIGIYESANAFFAVLQTIFIIFWMYKRNLMQVYGLNRPKQPAGKMLYYLPLIAVSTSNLWLGIKMNLEPAELAVHIVLMLCVGFLEELFVRGFIFKALAKDNLKFAIAVSSLAFGAAHIMNLFNGRGMDVKEVFFQILMAVIFGFFFVMIYLYSGSLWPVILSHSCINILSAFANREALSVQNHVIVQLWELMIIASYLFYLKKKFQDLKNNEII